MTFRTKAIVLKSMSWPRQARFFVLYTPEHGKLKGVAMGADKIQSKVAGHLPPFGISEVMVARGRAVDRIAQARIDRVFGACAGQYRLYVLASYALEVVERLSREGVGDRQLWDELVAVLHELNEQGAWGLEEAVDDLRFDWLARLFAFRVLDRLGYRPQLRACLHCHEPARPDGMYFSVLQSGLFCAGCFRGQAEGQPLSGSAIKLLRASLDLPFDRACRVVCDPADHRLAMTIVDQLVAVQLQEPLRSIGHLV